MPDDPPSAQGPRDPLEEPAFLDRLRARDTRAFDQLVRAYQRRVFSLVARMLGNPTEAEDVAQEVFVQVFRAVDQFRGESKFSTWIFRIAVNLSKNRSLYLQRRGQGKETEDAHEIADRVPLGAATKGTAAIVARPDHLVEGMQVERIVQQAIADLEPTFRECLMLRHVENLSYDEIAELTGLPAGTVRSRIHRARAAVRLALEAALGEEVGGKLAVGKAEKNSADASPPRAARRNESAVIAADGEAVARDDDEEGES